MSTLPDALDEARRIVAEAAERRLTLRLLGGLAVRLHSPSASHRSLSRPYPDLDFALPEKRGDRVEAFLPEIGYVPNRSFNLFNGDRRLLFYDETHERQVDIFVGRFQMCHRIPITERLSLEPLTIPLAELLLTKMQVVKLNEKDVRDLCALLVDHPFGEGDVEMFNLPFIVKQCMDEWGLWKTVTLNAGKVGEYCESHDLEAGHETTILERLQALRQALDAAPRSLKWKARDKIGERMPWYELPEEVQRG